MSQLNYRTSSWCLKSWRIGCCGKNLHTFGVRNSVSVGEVKFPFSTFVGIRNRHPSSLKDAVQRWGGEEATDWISAPTCSLCQVPLYSKQSVYAAVHGCPHGSMTQVGPWTKLPGDCTHVTGVGWCLQIGQSWFSLPFTFFCRTQPFWGLRLMSWESSVWVVYIITFASLKKANQQDHIKEKTLVDMEDRRWTLTEHLFCQALGQAFYILGQPSFSEQGRLESLVFSFGAVSAKS